MWFEPHPVAAAVALSIVLHSSSEVVVGRAFDQPGETPAWQDVDPDTALARGPDQPVDAGLVVRAR